MRVLGKGLSTDCSSKGLIRLYFKNIGFVQTLLLNRQRERERDGRGEVSNQSTDRTSLSYNTPGPSNPTT